MEISLICMAIALVGGLMMSRLTRLLHLPAVTAYLVAGLLLGPFFIGALKISGLGFNSLDQVENFRIVTQTALGFIAFAMGNEFRLAQLKTIGGRAVVIGILQAVITTVLVDVVLVGLHLLYPSMISIPCAITLGAIAAATAPAATLMVVRQYKADGPLTRLLMLVVALDDAVGLLLFSVSFGVATALSNGQVNVIAVVVEPIVEIILSVGLGAAMGFLLNWVEQFFHSRSKRMTLSVAFVLLTVGLSMMEFDIGPVHCGFSLLLVCMMTGTVFCNVCDTSEELMSRVDGWTAPLNVLFFVISGAELDLQVLASPVTVFIGVLYIVARSAGKYLGANLSCRITREPKPIVDHLGITLLPQAGVALGMAITAASLPDGALARNVVLFAVLVYELVGPTLTKRSLMAVGEIRPEGRTSARTPNMPKMEK
ncbi:MAG: cation:proton antiporter [Clostridiales bacterium]|nr:cation:proton antiporter [Clostridiales bacterium]MDD7386694.1 cation:proton antiporter [Bacillota bacterium]MDY6041768.1 cation:proton antiporter [Candidatus Faecousia sp.]